VLIDDINEEMTNFIIENGILKGVKEPVKDLIVPQDVFKNIW